MELEEQSNSIQEADQDIPLEEATRKELVPFDDNELAAAVTDAGIVYVSVPEICRALGLVAQPQILRMRRTRVLHKGLRRIPLATRGGVKPTYCLRADLIALWLGGIEFSRTRHSTEQQQILQEKIEYYQEELAPVATQVFMRVLGLHNTQIVPQEPDILDVAEQLDISTDVATLLREHLESVLETQGYHSMQLDRAISLLESLLQRQGKVEQLESQLEKVDERTKYLTPTHARQVRALVDRIAAALAEGGTPDMTAKQAYIRVYSRLRTHFRTIGSYKEIDDDRFDEIVQFLKDELVQALRGEGPAQQSLF